VKKNDAGLPYSRTYAVLIPIIAFLLKTILPVRYSGLENLNREGPFILIGNHLSMVDPVLMAVPMKKRQVTFLSKKELSRIPVVGAFLRLLHPIFVDRHASDMEAMRACMKTLRDGGVLGIFPEGTRSHGGTMEHIESGVALMALRSKVPVVPVYITGKIGLFRPLDVVFGEPVEMDDLRQAGVNNETCQELVNRIRVMYKEFAKSRQTKKA